MFYHLGEAVHTSGGSHFSADLEKSSPVQNMVFLLVKSDVNMHSHAAVILQYFETIAR